MIFNFRGAKYNLIRKAKDWTQSSVVDDKRELTAYQYFVNEFENIDKKVLEYINEEGYSDKRLYVDMGGRLVSISTLESLKDIYKQDTSLSVNERAIKVATLNNMYNKALEDLKNRIINMAVSCRDNIYLVTIATSIVTLNALINEYAYMQAIQKSGVKVIDGGDAAVKLKSLKNSIEIRIMEINSRITIEESYKRS